MIALPLFGIIAGLIVYSLCRVSGTKDDPTNDQTYDKANVEGVKLC